jgi:hypothetical protein
MVRKLDLLEFGPVLYRIAGAGDNKPTRWSRVLDPFRFVLLAVTGWMNQREAAGH